jgi:hypothetical protein
MGDPTNQIDMGVQWSEPEIMGNSHRNAERDADDEIDGSQSEQDISDAVHDVSLPFWRLSAAGL